VAEVLLAAGEQGSTWGKSFSGSADGSDDHKGYASKVAAGVSDFAG
jgi:hypothetical protein